MAQEIDGAGCGCSPVGYPHSYNCKEFKLRTPCFEHIKLYKGEMPGMKDVVLTKVEKESLEEFIRQIKEEAPMLFNTTFPKFDLHGAL